MSDYRCDKCGSYKVVSKFMNTYYCRKCHDKEFGGKTIVSSSISNDELGCLLKKSLFAGEKNENN